ncbi:MAG: PaaI family thioesterase [Pseudomonadota bacterium]
MTTEADNIALWNSIHIPFATELGFQLTGMVDGSSEIQYTPRPEHLNTFGVTHGGASMTLLDVAMAAAARSVAPDLGVITIEMKTTFMQAARGALVARGKLVHRTISMAFLEASVFDSRGRLCTHATGTFKYVPRPAVPDGTRPAVSTD